MGINFHAEGARLRMHHSTVHWEEDVFTSSALLSPACSSLLPILQHEKCKNGVLQNGAAECLLVEFFYTKLPLSQNAFRFFNVSPLILEINLHGI